MSKNYEIDKIDLKILELLMQDAKTPYTEIAKKVLRFRRYRTRAACVKWKKWALCKGTTLSMDYSKLGMGSHCVSGYLPGTQLAYTTKSAHKLKDRPAEVVKIHYTTGDYSIFVKLHCKDTKHLRDVLHDKIQKIDGIRSNRNLSFLWRKALTDTSNLEL